MRLPGQLLFGDRGDLCAGRFLDDTLELFRGVLDDLWIVRLVGKHQQHPGLAGCGHGESLMPCRIIGNCTSCQERPGRHN